MRWKRGAWDGPDGSPRRPRPAQSSLFNITAGALGERHHQADMLQAFKIIRGFDKVDNYLVSEGGCFHQDNQKCGRPNKSEATSSETGNKEKFLLKQSSGSMEHGPWRHKKIENSEQFQTCIQKPQKEYSGERPGRLREESGGSTSETRLILRDPTWVIGCKQTRNKKQMSLLLTPHCRHGSRVADPYPGSGALLTPGIRDG